MKGNSMQCYIRYNAMCIHVTLVNKNIPVIGFVLCQIPLFQCICLFSVKGSYYIRLIVVNRFLIRLYINRWTTIRTCVWQYSTPC